MSGPRDPAAALPADRPLAPAARELDSLAEALERRATMLAADATNAGEPPGTVSRPRDDAHLKPFFPVKSLSQARERARALGGELGPATEEWTAHGFRACEAVDPDGNRIQFREIAP